MLGVERESEFKFSEEETFVAHLPFLTRERLALRVAQGKDLAKSGYSRDHGWQSQVVNQMAIEGRLDEYWQHNSISIDVSHSEKRSPKTIRDERLSPVLQGAVVEFTATIDSIDLSSSRYQSQCGPTITLSQGINSARAIALYKQKGIDQANSQVVEAHVHISNLNNHIQNLQTQLQEQAAQNSAQREEMLNSISWRATRFIRSGHRLILNSSITIRTKVTN